MEIKGLSESEKTAYRQLKTMINKIYYLKNLKDYEDIKYEFTKSYVKFASELKNCGHENECNDFMMISEMFYELIERPKS